MDTTTTANAATDREMQAAKNWDERSNKDGFREVTKAQFDAWLTSRDTPDVHPKITGSGPYVSHFNDRQGWTLGRVFDSGWPYDGRPARYELSVAIKVAS